MNLQEYVGYTGWSDTAAEAVSGPAGITCGSNIEYRLWGTAKAGTTDDYTFAFEYAQACSMDGFERKAKMRLIRWR